MAQLAQYLANTAQLDISRAATGQQTHRGYHTIH